MRITAGLVCGLLAATSVQAAWGFGGNKASNVPASIVDDAPAPAPVAPPVDYAQPSGAATPLSSDDPSSPFATTTPKAPYTGTQYSIGIFKSIRPAELVYEGLALVGIVLYVIFCALGKRYNDTIAKAWYEANYDAFIAEFAAFGMPGGGKYKADGGDEFLAYATGRRGVESALVTVKTKPWNDPWIAVYNLLRPLIEIGWQPAMDVVTIDFKLRSPEGTPNSKFVFAVTSRQTLRSIRDSRWDLKTFTQTSEFASLPTSFIVMTESGEISNALLKNDDTGLMEVLQSGLGKWIESVVISDMPREEPSENKPVLPTEDYTLTITMKLPPKAQCGETKPLIHLACNIADVLYLKPKLVQEIALVKRKQRRAEVLAKLQKAANDEKRGAEKEAKENALVAKKKLEKEALESKLAKMSKEERIKYNEKEKERERKKLIKSMSKKR